MPPRASTRQAAASSSNAASSSSATSSFFRRRVGHSSDTDPAGQSIQSSAANQHAVDDSCYASTLSRLVGGGACLRRESFGEAGVQPLLPQLAVYVLSVPALAQRARRMTQRLTAARVHDVTWVYCANRDHVAHFDAATRACIHPEYVQHPWSRGAVMANGTLSLAIKHQIAARDIVQRGLPAAIVLEDDAIVPSDLWRRLALLETPRDADVFYLGSYSSRAHVGTLRAEPAVVAAASVSSGGGGKAARGGGGSGSGSGGLSIHRRTAGGQPLLLGANAYILFAKAAAALLAPIVTEADITLTLLDAPTQCRTQRGTAGRAPVPERCSHLRTPPPRQFGPSAWLMGQDTQHVEQKTHYDWAQKKYGYRLR